MTVKKRKPATKKAKSSTKRKVSGIVKAGGVSTARKAISAAIKAVKEGKKGSTSRLNKAITAYAVRTCKLKSKPRKKA